VTSHIIFDRLNFFSDINDIFRCPICGGLNDPPSRPTLHFSTGTIFLTVSCLNSALMVVFTSKYKNFVVITLKNLSKIQDSNTILDNISLEINEGDIIGIIGQSGSGKSTLLRCIAQIEPYDSGEINFMPGNRLGMVFQNFNIFKNMSVMENLCYPQRKVLNRSKAEAEGIALDILKRVNMLHCFNRTADQMSGGQKQLIAIARTLCMDPTIILFDEPTSALDPENVVEILNLIKSIADNNISMVIVSHEIRFVRSISNRMMFMQGGKITLHLETKEFFKYRENLKLNKFLDSLLQY
jgi:ABC-type polar amino acid transport system ATPase subunit